jgi:hypothetical protein
MSERKLASTKSLKRYVTFSYIELFRFYAQRMTRTLSFLTSKLTKAAFLAFAGMLLTSIFVFIETTPASAANPVGSIQFNGNNSMKFWPGAPGSQNTTIEFWMKQTGTGNLQRIYTTSWSFAGNNITIRASGTGCLEANVANIELSKPSGTDYTCPSRNVWHHIALVGLGTTWNFYVDGNLAKTKTWTEATKPNITDSSASIGGWENSERFSGYISNVREVIGTAVYTSSFTPVNPPLEATQSAGSSGINAITSGTKILLNTLYDGTLATAQVDTSGNSLTPQLYGTPVASSETPVLTATSITNFTIQSLTYGSSATMRATSSVAGKITFLANGSAISGCSNVSEDVSNTASCTFTPATTSSVAYTLNFTPTSTGFASLSGVNSTSVTAAKAILSVQPSASSVAYGGSPSYSLTYSGFVNNETTTSSTFTTGLTPPTCSSASYTTTTSVSASPLTISCSGGISTNYSFNTSATSNLTISKARPTLNSWANLPKNYGDPSFALEGPTTNTPGTFTYGSSNSSIISLSADTATVVAVGTSVITATFTPTDEGNFLTGETKTMTISVGQAQITVTPDSNQSKVYGTSDPVITYSVTSGALVGSDQLTGTLTYAGAGQNTATGSYAITSGTLTSANNPSYTITLASVNFAITKSSQSAVSLSSLSAAYNPSNKSVSLTGSGGSGSGTYEYALHASNTTAGCSVSGSTLTYTTAGTCVIAVKRTTDTNYLERTDAVSFSIGLASQTITFGSLSAKSYSSDTFTVSATSSASLTVVFTSGSPSICTTSGTSGSTITLLGVGTCVLNANQSGDANIAAASQVTQNFTVDTRAITVTADAKSKVYGSSDPTFTYSITTGSLVLGDSLTGALTRAAGTDVGTYQIQQGALTTGNNPKYAITFVGADLSITRATPTLVLSYPNSNVAILRPGATDTPTVTTSSSSGALTFATSAAISICTVDATTGVISLLGAGSCPVTMTTALTTNFIAHAETTTVMVALLSSSLVGIDTNDLVSMGQPFFSHATIDQSYSFSSGSNGASVAIPAGTLDPSVPISISLLTDSADQRAMIGGTGTSVLSVVVSWVASDGSVPVTNTGKAISVTLTNPSIKSGAKIYSIIGNQSTLLGTATADGSVTTLITEDPVLLVINPVVSAPVASASTSGAVDNSAAIAAAQAKLAADKAAAELKAMQDKATAEAIEAAAIKAAQELADGQAQAAATLKAAEDKAAEDLRISEELRLANLKAEEDLKAAAAKKAADDIARAALTMKPGVTLYSVSPKLKLSAFDNAYLETYVKSLKNGAAVTCIGYTYTKNTTLKKATVLAKSQATAVCAQMKKTNKTLKTSIVIYPATKAPKAAPGSKYVAVSYRIDGIKK